MKRFLKIASKHLEEMRRMNGHVKIDGNIAVIEGGHELQGALVYATDLRAAAAFDFIRACVQTD